MIVPPSKVVRYNCRSTVRLMVVSCNYERSDGSPRAVHGARARGVGVAFRVLGLAGARAARPRCRSPTVAAGTGRAAPAGEELGEPAGGRPRAARPDPAPPGRGEPPRGAP